MKSNLFSQGFGEDRACAKTDQVGNPIRPFHIKTRVGDTCGGGYISFYSALNMKGHNGEDWSTWDGEPMFFPVDMGEDMEWTLKHHHDQDGGLGVDIFSKKPIYFDKLPEQAGPQARLEWEANNGYIYIKFRFWHMSERASNNITIKLGDFIGLASSTGASSGPHLHLGMKFVDKYGTTYDKNNGYYGAVDLRQASGFVNLFVMDVLNANETSSEELQEDADDTQSNNPHDIPTKDEEGTDGQIPNTMDYPQKINVWEFIKMLWEFIHSWWVARK